MNMRVHNIMVNNPVVVGLGTSALELAEIMTVKRIGLVIITDGDKPVISCSEFADLEDAVDIMKDYNIRRIVVIDDDQRLVGILTFDDIVANLKELSEDLAMKFLVFSRARK